MKRNLNKNWKVIEFQKANETESIKSESLINEEEKKVSLKPKDWLENWNTSTPLGQEKS